MSAAKSEATLEAKLKKLQCHFTWDLDDNKARILRVSDKLEDIGTDEGNCWLGHIYNLQGYIHSQLGTDEAEEARSFFSKATEALNQTRKAEKGPWLLVNYGNLAWMHYHQGEEAESQDYLSKVAALEKEFPSPSQDELHPEICAEKAWTLLKFSREQKELAGELFQKAIEMQPDMVEWQSSHVIGLANTHKDNKDNLEPDFMETMQKAKEQDPENLYLAALYLKQRTEEGERVDDDEVSELASKILRNPVSSYSGIKVILRIYRGSNSYEEATALAEEALQKHPDERFLKICLALCYKWQIQSRGSRQTQMTDKAISLHEEVISLYPHSCFVKTMDLASVYSKTGKLGKADDIFRELLKRDLPPAEKQILYNTYAKYLNFDHGDRNRSVDYHMKAAKITEESYSRQNSIKALEKISARGRHPRSREIQQLLDRL